MLQNLKHIINQNGEGTSFFDYRMRMLNYPALSKTIESRINKFFSLLNTLFGETNKEIKIDPKNNSLVFYMKDRDDAILLEDGSHLLMEDGGRFLRESDIIKIDQLSSGEK